MELSRNFRVISSDVLVVADYFGASLRVCNADTIRFVESVKALRSYLSNPTLGAPIPDFSHGVYTSR